MNQILVVEDDETIALGVEYALETEKFRVFKASRCLKALEIVKAQNIDLALLDINLPDGNGYDLCKEIKEIRQVPVIFLTVYDEEANIVMGLDMGADDYLTKPFRIKELVARINAVLRRNNKTPKNTKNFRYKNLYINCTEGKVYKNDEEIAITSIEYRLILMLFSNQGRIISRAQILNKIWDLDGEFINDNTLTVTIKRLREKIEEDPHNPQIIKTLRGLGYRLGD